MLIRISDLEPAGLTLAEQLEIPDFSWEGGQTVHCGTVRIDATIRPSSRGVEVSASGSCVARLVCVRCLDDVAMPIQLRFRLFVKRVGEEDVEEESPEDDSDAVDLYGLEGDELDLREVLREQIDLALPLTPLCSEDCRGLCAGCGASLNVEQCRCRAPKDERWSALKDLRSALSERRDSRRSGGN
jgi:uncharacterized protein